MARAQRQISDGSNPVPAVIPQPATPAAVRAIDADILPEPVSSPARALQQRLNESAADILLPRPVGSRHELPVFILCAVLLWAAALSAIIGLMVLAR